MIGWVKSRLPSPLNAGLALLSAALLILAFPDFEFWFLAFVALVPLLIAIERQSGCVHACFLIGWLFGTAFFFGTCWWLTYAPIHYASVPWAIAYALILIACLGAGIFPGIFAAILAVLIRRFGSSAFLAAPFVWVFAEFLRYWVTGNNWNAIGYSQAFVEPMLRFAHFGGVLLIGHLILLPTALLCVWFKRPAHFYLPIVSILLFAMCSFARGILPGYFSDLVAWEGGSMVVGMQPNVPMSGLDQQKLEKLRSRQAELARIEIEKLRAAEVTSPISVILPESPMNFMYDSDREFQSFIHDFARRNNVSVLFNSAEPDRETGKFYNSAVMVSPEGREAAQYDKIYLLPFGEAVPPPLEGIVPGFVGNFAYGREYDLLPFGDAKGGVMICFESHFGQLSREYVRNGADVLIEMTNDGYLGPTPVLRQHLANAVFRAVETNRPVLRVTNVGITAYINERGQVLDELPPYWEGTRVWSVAKSDGSQTFYVRYGDWFAWLCVVATVGLLLAGLRRRESEPPAVAGG